MKTFKQHLLKEINEAIEEGKGIEVLISNPNTPRTETIINPVENLPYKLEYYAKAYDDELQHNHDKSVKIVAFRKVESDKIAVDLDL